MELTVTSESEVRDQGSIILVEGVDEYDAHHWIACDRRMALPVIEAAQQDDVTVVAEDWQLWGPSW